MPETQALILEEYEIVLSDVLDRHTHSLSPEFPNVVRAWHIIVRGRVSAHGQSVSLVAHTVTFEEGALIDTSGANGKNHSPGFAPTPQIAVGQLGSKGDDGGDGQDGGRIEIFAAHVDGFIRVRASGGAGGRGQDGGEGGPGASYSRSKPAYVRVAPSPEEYQGFYRHGGGGGPWRDSTFEPLPANLPAILAPGISGGRGGSGGPGGKPGLAGNGATLDVRTFPPQPPPTQIEADLSGGSAAPPSSGGSGGEGGEGSAGPPYIKVVRRGVDGNLGQERTFAKVFKQGNQDYPDLGNPAAMEGTMNVAVQIAQGPKGSKGARGDKGTDGTPGAAGKPSTPRVSPLTPAALAQVCSTSQMQYALQAAEILYQNDYGEEAVPLLQWVTSIGSLIRDRQG